MKGVRRSKTDAKNDYQNDTALHGAERHDHIAVVSKSTKDDPDFVYAENDAGETPLYMALERGFKNMVAQILGTCTAAIYQGPDGRTALRAAVYYNDKGGVFFRCLWLINRGIILCNKSRRSCCSIKIIL